MNLFAQSSKRAGFAAVTAAFFLVFLSPAFATPVEIDLTPNATRNIQANLFPTFPTGHVVPPLNSFGVPFYFAPSGKNFFSVESDSPVSVHAGVFGVKKVFALIQAYGPHAGDRICTVDFVGNAGAQ